VKRLLVILLILTTGGCASEDFWVQKGKTEPDMQIARYECQTQLRDKYGFYGGETKSPEYVKDFRQCMMNKGYTLQEEKKK
jgi:hypothetical protein